MIKNSKIEWFWRAFWLILSIPAIVLGVLYCLLPSVVPVHYNINMIIDRMGSPLVFLVLAILPLIITVGLTIFSFCKKEMQNKTTFYFALTIVSIFVQYLGWLLYFISNSGKQLGDYAGFSLALLIVVPLGILFVVMGNISPRLPKNNLVGIRIKTNDPTVYKKVQYVGSIAMVICGIVLLLACLIFGLLHIDIGIFITLIVCLVLFILVVSVTQYRATKESKNSQQNLQN